MWHEARKQERKIRGIMVDYKKRADRRRDFYEKIKADPTQFLQIHGRPAKIHLDPAIVAAADSPASMMPWQGRPDLLIDRFDVRAHLDHISENVSKEPAPNEIIPREDRMINYERYRIIVQNEFLGVDEEKFLHQLYLEEQFGPVPRPPEEKKKPRASEKAAIPYTYDDAAPAVTTASASSATAMQQGEKQDESLEPGDEAREADDDDDSDIDFDLCVDVSQVTPDQAHEMNKCGANYGMVGVDFFSFLTNDVEEKESLRLAREQEEEKAMYSGRKSRRERRAFREKRLQGRKISPPSYAARTSPTYDPYRKSTSKSRSRSRSPSPTVPGQITYITSFGGEEDGGATLQPQPGTSKCSPASRSRSPHRTTSKWSSRSRGHPARKISSSRSPDRNKNRSREEKTHYRRNRSRSTSRQKQRRRRSSSSSSLSSERSRNRTTIDSAVKDPQEAAVQPLPPPPVRRYYGRRGASSSSELDLSDSDSEKKTDSTSEREKPAPAHKNLGSTGLLGNTGAGTKQKIAPQERLKRKMQILLNKQFKADKRAERMRYAKQQQERQDREDELREMAIKLRRREREKRHRMKDGEEEDLDGEEYVEEDEDDGEGRDGSSVSSGTQSRSPSPPPAQYRRNRWDQTEPERDRRNEAEMERRREMMAEHHREMEASRRREAEFDRRRQAAAEWEHEEMYRRRRPDHQDYRREREGYWDGYRDGYREREPYWEREHERPGRSPQRKGRPRYGEGRPYHSHWRS